MVEVEEEEVAEVIIKMCFFCADYHSLYTVINVVSEHHTGLNNNFYFFPFLVNL